MLNTFTNEKIIKILFVDDDKNFLKSATECLKLHGNFEITCAFSVPEALEVVSKKEIDVIISDIQMPPTDGIAFLKILRQKNIDIPFIIFTATEDKQKALEAFSLGANGFVGKMGDPQTIFSTLDRCIEKALNRIS